MSRTGKSDSPPAPSNQNRERELPVCADQSRERDLPTRRDHQSGERELPASGRIEVICGCMFAGKTAELIRRLETARTAGVRVLAIKHQLDARYDATRLATHDGHFFDACAVATAQDVTRAAQKADVIGIDEGHFFGGALAEAAAALAEQGKRLIIVGIDNDAWGRPFPPFPVLKTLASEVTHLTAPCRVCAKPADFSQRMVPLGSDFMVGGPSEYEPRCAACFVPLAF